MPPLSPQARSLPRRPTRCAPCRFSWLPLWLFLSLLTLVQADESSDLRAIVERHYPWLNSTGPGVLTGVWEGSSPVALMAYGYGNLDLNGSGTPGSAVPLSFTQPMRIASLTKTFTVTRILQLAAEGRFAQGLDTPISAFEGMAMPDGRTPFSTAGLLTDPARFSGAHPVTLRHLANMTSSFADYTRTPEMLDGLINDITTPYTPDELVAFATGKPPATTLWDYSNTNTVLLGMVVEAVTGRSLEVELQNGVIDYAGLSSATFLPTDNGVSSDFAHGYAPGDEAGEFDDLTPAHPSMAAGAGGMISDFDDLRLWAEILATGKLEDGTSLYGPGDHAALHAERLALVEAEGVGPHYDRYGLGIGEIEGWLGHSGEFLGYQHIVMYDPAHDRTVVIMLNASGLPDRAHLPTEIFTDIALYYTAIPEPAEWMLLLTGAGLLGAMRFRSYSPSFIPAFIRRSRKNDRMR